MSIIDRTLSYVSHLFDSTPPAQPVRSQEIPITRIHLPDYQVAPARVAPTSPRGSERVFQSPAPTTTPRPSSSSNNGLGATLLGGALLVGGALLSESGIGVGMMIAGFGILGTGCGPADESPNNFNANIPEAGVPPIGSEYCSGSQRLIESNSADQRSLDAGSQSLDSFPGIRAYLESRLPEGLNLNNALVATSPNDRQYVYVLAHTADGAPLAEVGTSNVIFRFRREGSNYVPADYPRSLPIGGMRNALYNSFVGPSHMAYLTQEDFQNGVEMNGRRVNLSSILTSNPVIAILFNDPLDPQEPIRISYINYESGNYIQIPGGGRDSLNACSTYSEIVNSPVPDASVEAGMDTGTRVEVDASVDVRTDTYVDAPRDVISADRPLQMPWYGHTPRTDAARDANREGGVDAGADARMDATVDGSRG